ncbi:MAG TPA: pectate lyase, partial [Flavobacteriaceae bacterium]|nr:pectate lyase [Flavobacteriaceae bacterium]
NEGLLTPKKNGTVTVTATATDGSGITDSLEINISGVVLTNLRAENMLLWQRSNGGWPKEPYNDFSGYDRQQTEEEIATAMNTKDNTDTTIDNGHTVGEIRTLLSAYKGTNNANYLAGAEKGIDYLLEAQYDNGGWPQYYPLRDNYSRHITYNDNAMANVMNLLWDIYKQQNNADLVNPSYIDVAKTAFDKGIDIMLQTQLSYNGKKAIWCAQHDEVTLEAAAARSYELPSFSGSESVGVVRTLMLVEQPSQEIIDAISNAIDWFNESKIVGYNTQTVYDSSYPDGFDVIVVEDPGHVMWARFYDLDTSLPFFCGRDGIKKSTLAEIEYERRTGYAWYGNWPASLISNDYPAWKTRNGL